MRCLPCDAAAQRLPRSASPAAPAAPAALPPAGGRRSLLLYALTTPFKALLNSVTYDVMMEVSCYDAKNMR